MPNPAHALLLGGAPAAAGAITQVQKKDGSEQTTTAYALTFDSSPTQNNLLIAVLATAASVSTVTVPTGFTFATLNPVDQAAHANGSLVGRTLSIAYKVAGAGESSTVTWGTSASVAQDGMLLEYSGLLTSGVEDKTAANGTASTVTSLDLGTTATTSIAKELVIAAVSKTNTATSNALTNGVVIQTADGRCTVGALVLSATQAVQTTASWTNNSITAAGAIVTFKGA